MKTIDLLSTTLAHGFLWLVLFFCLCFLAIHIARLVKLGRKYQQQRKAQQAPPPAPQKKTPPQDEREPIYYIVEKKRRAKTSYSDPKRIHFK